MVLSLIGVFLMRVRASTTIPVVALSQSNPLHANYFMFRIHLWLIEKKKLTMSSRSSTFSFSRLFSSSKVWLCWRRRATSRLLTRPLEPPSAENKSLLTISARKNRFDKDSLVLGNKVNPHILHTNLHTHNKLTDQPATHSPSSKATFCPPMFSLILLKSWDKSFPALSDSLLKLDREADLRGGDLPGEKLRLRNLKGMAVTVSNACGKKGRSLYPPMNYTSFLSLLGLHVFFLIGLMVVLPSLLLRSLWKDVVYIPQWTTLVSSLF